MVIYADVLVCINILITYIFLVCSRVVINLPTSKWGIILSSVVGGFSALIILWDDMGVMLSVIYKLIVSAVITYLAFMPSRIRAFLKACVTFSGVSMLFGGVMYFIELTFKPHNIMYYNGTIYFDMNIKYLIGCTFIIYGVFLGANYFLQKKSFKNEVYTVCIGFRNTEVTLRGFVDTGNSLSDGLTGKAVCVAELKAVAPLFTYEELMYFKSGEMEKMPDSLVGTIRFIPCETVGESFFLPVVTPHKAEVKLKNKKVKLKNMCIAIADKNFADGEYNLILNKNIFDLV